MPSGEPPGNWRSLDRFRKPVTLKVFSHRCLEAGARQVLSNEGAAGVDHVSVNDFASRLTPEVGKLSQSLRDGSYHPQAIRRKNIPKPGSKEPRPLGIPTVRDRVVQSAIVKVIEPIFERDAARALERVQKWTAENGLTLHPTKTKLVDVRIEGFDFLSYHFRGSKHWVSRKSLRSLKETIRQKTPSKSGRSLSCIIADVNRTLRGWFVYFKHSRPWVMIRLDCFIRQRLRTIVRKRSKRRGCARSGMNNRRWPNAYFAKHGLFNLVSARAKASQSSSR